MHPRGEVFLSVHAWGIIVRLVVALGGNALLKRGEEQTSENQRRNVREACRELAPLAKEHQLVITHGNGPQVGLLPYNPHRTRKRRNTPGCSGRSDGGMLGYAIQQELGNLLPTESSLATILTMVEVDPDDPAFENPTKPIGPIYSEHEARRISEEKGWSISKDGSNWRRLYPLLNHTGSSSCGRFTGSWRRG